MIALHIQSAPLSEDILAWYDQQPPAVVADALTIGRTALTTPRTSAESNANTHDAALRRAHLETSRCKAELAELQQKLTDLRNQDQDRDSAIIKTTRELCNNELATKDQEIQRLHQQILQMTTRAEVSQEIYAKLEPLLSQHSTAHAKGVAGENLVRNVFDKLEGIGSLEDTRFERGVGCEDFLFTTNDGLRCNVEVKNVEAVHAAHDMQKHLLRVQEAARTERINGAIFLSLRCKIPHMRPLQLKEVAGIPVLYVSGGDMTPAQVAEIGFRVMAQLWPLLRNSKNDTGSSTIEQLSHSVTKLVSMQLNALIATNRQIEDVESHANSILRTAHRMRRLRQEQLDAITHLQTTHDLWPEPSSGARTVTSVTDVENAVRTYYNANMRYPKTEEHLGIVLPMSIELEHVVRRVKAEIARERATEHREQKKHKRDERPPPPPNDENVEYDAFTKMVLAGIGSSSEDDD